MSVGENIKKRLDELGMNQKELSTLSRIGTSTINKIVSDKGNPTAEKIKKIAIALETSTDRLLFDEDEIEDDEIKILMREVEKFPRETKKTVKEMLKALIIQNKSKELNKRK